MSAEELRRIEELECELAELKVQVQRRVAADESRSRRGLFKLAAGAAAGGLAATAVRPGGRVAADDPNDIELGSEFSQDSDPRYAGEPIPRAEALAQVLERALPYWESDVVPDLKARKTVLVAAHGNSIRAIVKHLDDVDADTIAGINIPTGIPLLYELDEETLKPVTKGGQYLDPKAAAEAIKAVANQGR